MDYEALEKLKELKDKEIITEEEFAQKKKEIMSSGTVSKSKPQEPVLSDEDKIRHQIISNLWYIALAPLYCYLIGMFIVALIKDAVPEISSGFLNSFVFGIMYGFSVNICIKDKKMLEENWHKKIEIQPSNVPMYLKERAEVLNEPPISMWVWIILFIKQSFILFANF